MDSMGVRIAITIAFAATGVFCLVRCVDLGRRTTRGDRLAYGVHVLMAVAMVAMAWSPVRLVGAQMTLFAVAAAWFAIRALGIPSTALRLAGPSTALRLSGPSAELCVSGSSAAPRPTAEVAVAVSAVCRAERIRCLHHAASMGAMVWMFGVLTRPGGMAAMHGGRAAGSATGLIAVLAAAYCLVAACLLAVMSMSTRDRRAGHGDRRDDIANAVMSAGMGAALLALA